MLTALRRTHPLAPRPAAAAPSPAVVRPRTGLSAVAWIYLSAVSVTAASAQVAALGALRSTDVDWTTFALLAAAAAVAHAFVVITPRNQSYHTTIAFLIAAV